MTADELTRLRERMDAINARLCAVLQERAALCQEIGAWKGRHGKPAADPSREAAMLSQLLAAQGPGFDREALARILRCVFDESRALVATSLSKPQL
jgi:hypothetical protein